MSIKKIIRFILMNRYEKKRSIIRNIYSYLNKFSFKKIGKKSYILDPIFVSGTKYIEMGEDVGIWHNARIELIDYWQNEKYNPKLVIGNHVNIGQDLHLTCAEEIIIEDGVVCSGRVTITDISHVTDNFELPVLNQKIITKPVKILEGAMIGINSTILPGVIVGKHSVVGANSVVCKDVPDYSIVCGAPARIIKTRSIK